MLLTLSSINIYMPYTYNYIIRKKMSQAQYEWKKNPSQGWEKWNNYDTLPQGFTAFLKKEPDFSIIDATMTNGESYWYKVKYFPTSKFPNSPKWSVLRGPISQESQVQVQTQTQQPQSFTTVAEPQPARTYQDRQNDINKAHEENMEEGRLTREEMKATREENSELRTSIEYLASRIEGLTSVLDGIKQVVSIIAERQLTHFQNEIKQSVFQKEKGSPI